MVYSAPPPMGPREVERCAHIMALILTYVAPCNNGMSSADEIEQILLKYIEGTTIGCYFIELIGCGSGYILSILGD